MITQVRINHNEPLYTLEEARNVLTWEQRKRREVYRKKFLYYAVQKLCGVTLIVLAVVLLLVFRDEDATPCIIVMAFGVWLLFTKSRGLYT